MHTPRRRINHSRKSSNIKGLIIVVSSLFERDFSHVKVSNRNIRSLMFLLKLITKQGKRQLSLHRVQDHGQERLIPQTKLQC
ncbi:hypothetical protein AOXY_G12029 [Acipenser oxyrinchus oxyrinchus]|uniref:Uncharacterized protein n=1 Tax=Acipenser oxyrinchus oxyrinchus TaxID=40147 RepID=A0AAD8DFW7_ACIOX|nr:hypothetical protein AOXY_G12029 [Acipenser oxyrinchus oxyrinchus]